MDRESLVLRLFQAGCVQFGHFKLKSGVLSPIYVDLRLLVSDPTALRQVADALVNLIQSQPPLSFDRIAAIPYAALPIGVALSLALNRPMIYPRKEIKSYGTSRPIEGRFEVGEKVLLLDDLITRADSKLEAIAPLQQAGLVVEDILVVLDREQGGSEALAKHGYRLHSLMTLRDMLALLAEQGAITPQQHNQVLDYLNG
jgi:uridine monophosphate synthetase